MAMANRNPAETRVPATAPKVVNESNRSLSEAEKTAIAMESAITIVEWPSEKKRPTPTGRLPSCMSLRVTLSIAAMWSASKAWRRPKL